MPPEQVSPPDLQPQPAPQPDTAQPAATPLSPAAPQHSKKKLFLIALSAVVLLLVIAIGWLYWNSQQNNPTKTFNAALTKFLQVKTITQSASSPGTNITGSQEADLSDIKNPKISVALGVKDSGLSIKLSGYGSPKNEYIKYNTFGSLRIDNAVSPIVNKWVQIRTNGTDAEGADKDLIADINPYSMLLGDFFMGNFSASQRQTILNTIAKDKIYSYDVSKVTRSTVDGKKVYVYSVTENIPKLKALNIKVAAMLGLKQADIQASVLDQLGTSGTTKVYIDVATKEVIKYTATADGNTVTGGYSEYDTTSLPQEPKADYTWAEFEQKEAAVAGGDFGGTSDTSNPAELQQT